MAREGMVIRFRGVKAWKEALKSVEFRKELNRNIERATMINAKRASAKQRQVIQSGTGLKANSALTAAIKDDNKPLVGDGTLFAAITDRKVSGGGGGSRIEVFSGVLRTNEAFNVGVIIHEGVAIRVTPKMRGMFYYLWLASTARSGSGSTPELTGRAAELFEDYQGWKPLSASTRVITIPARPWIKTAFESGDLRREAERNWTEAIRNTFRNRAAKSRSKG